MTGWGSPEVAAENIMSFQNTHLEVTPMAVTETVVNVELQHHCSFAYPVQVQEHSISTPEEDHN
jgi:hypothetical protein